MWVQGDPIRTLDHLSHVLHIGGLLAQSFPVSFLLGVICAPAARWNIHLHSLECHQKQGARAHPVLGCLMSIWLHLLSDEDLAVVLF